MLTEVDRLEVNRRFALLQQKARLYTSTVVANAIADLEQEGATTAEQKRALAREVLEPWGLFKELESKLERPVVSLELSMQRRLTLARLVRVGAEAVLADEPFRDLESGGEGPLLEMLRELSRRCALVMITHDQSKARALLDDVLLLTGGAVVEHESASKFFASPATELGRRFLRSGSCWPLEEEMDPEWLAHRRAQESGETVVSDQSQGAKPSWVPTAQERVVRPGGFHWVEQKLLGGMQWPGLLQDETADLDGLVALGVKHLVNLTEVGFPPGKLSVRGITGHHFPVVDMAAPKLEECLRLCREVDGWLRAGAPTVFHCRAGLGRTGTLLACMQVYQGRDAVSAIDRVRRVNSMYIQSQEQLSFVDKFAQFCERHDNLAQSAT